MKQLLKEIITKKADHAHANSKSFVFENRTVLIFINAIDEVGKIIKTSKNVKQVFGYQSHELEGIYIDSLLIPSMKNFHSQHV